MAEGYFGGLGAGKGWYKIPFFITDKELSDLFSKFNFHLIITNTRVDVDYIETKKEEFLKDYNKYIEVLKSQKKSDWKIESPLYISLTKDLSDIKSKLIESNNFKLLKYTEPLIDVSPLTIYYENVNKKDRLSIDCDGIKENVITAGLILHFPKVISLDNEGHRFLHKTDNSKNLELYNILVKYITEITKPCIIKSSVSKRKTRLRISKDCKKILNEHPFFKEKELIII